MEQKENSFTFLDLVIIIIENIKLLLIGPLLVGLIAMIIVNSEQKIYISHAILGLPSSANSKQAAELLRSRLVLAPIMTSASHAGRVVSEEEYLDFAKKIEVSLKKDGLIYLYVKGNSPQDAQRLASAIIDEWLKTTIPGEKTVEILKNRLKNSEVGLRAITALISKINPASLKNSSPLISENALEKLIELQQNFQRDVVEIPRLIEIDYHNIVKEPPTLAAYPILNNQNVKVVISVIVTGVLLLFFIFARQAWRSGAMVPETASKQALLLQVLGRNPR
jgi:hypothetical protein